MTLQVVNLYVSVIQIWRVDFELQYDIMTTLIFIVRIQNLKNIFK